MKLTITREQLQEGLVAVAASVPAKTTLPILSNILLEATKDGIRLSGTDLDISVSTTVSASVDQEGAERHAVGGALIGRPLVAAHRERPRGNRHHVVGRDGRAGRGTAIGQGFREAPDVQRRAHFAGRPIPRDDGGPR
mgnify:CR=1 FL=1